MSPSPTGLPRARGAARIAVARVDGASRLQDLYQSGCLRLRLPRTGDPAPVGTLINVAGGLTGGDRLEIAARVGSEAALTLATQSAERLYRASRGRATVDVRLEVEAGGRLAWLPRETIAFEGAALQRRLRIDLARGARVLGVESWVAGRTAMGEALLHADLRDSWRVRIDGKLVHAETLQLPSTQTAQWLASPAGWNGNRAIATVLVVAPEAGGLLNAVRALLGPNDAADAWEGEHARLVARLVAPDHLALSRRLVPLLALLNRRGLALGTGDDPHAALPLVWSV